MVGEGCHDRRTGVLGYLEGEHLQRLPLVGDSPAALALALASAVAAELCLPAGFAYDVRVATRRCREEGSREASEWPRPLFAATAREIGLRGARPASTSLEKFRWFLRVVQ